MKQQRNKSTKIQNKKRTGQQGATFCGGFGFIAYPDWYEFTWFGDFKTDAIKFIVALLRLVSRLS